MRYEIVVNTVYIRVYNAKNVATGRRRRRVLRNGRGTRQRRDGSTEEQRNC